MTIIDESKSIRRRLVSRQEEAEGVSPRQSWARGGAEGWPGRVAETVNEVDSLKLRLGKLERILAQRMQSEERLHQLFRSLPEAVALLDPRGRLMDGNPALPRIFGYSLPEARARCLDSLLMPPSAAAEPSTVLQQALTGRTVRAGGVRYRKDGEPVEVRISAYPVRLDGETVGVWMVYSPVDADRGTLAGSVVQVRNPQRLEERVEPASDASTPP